MSNFDKIQAEAKNVFLTFLINNDFLAGSHVYNGEYTRAVFQMHFVVTKIYSMVNTQEIKELYEKLNEWLDNVNSFSEEDLRIAYKEMSRILNEYFYSEMHLGIIPTSTLAGDKPKPLNEPISPQQSSRL